MSRRILSLLMLLATFNSVAQSFIFSDSIAKENLKMLWTDYNESFETPLLYVATFPLKCELSGIEASFVQCMFRNVEQQEQKYARFVDIDTIIKVESNVVYTKKRPFVQICFSPFVYDANGKLMVLSYFEIEIRGRQVPSMRFSNNAESSGSLLSSGNWFKIKVDTTGVYKLTYADLRKIGIENPQSTRVFTYGGEQLPECCSDDVLDDLNEIPICRGDGEDAECIVFYVQGPTVLKYDASSKSYLHKKHDYSDYTYLFLTSDFGMGKEIHSVDYENLLEDVSIDSYDSYKYYEKDKVNLVKSGRRWYDSKLQTNVADSVAFYFPYVDKSSPIVGVACMAGRKSNGMSAYFKFGYDGNTIGTSIVNDCYTNCIYAEYKECNLNFFAKSSRLGITYKYVSSDASSEGYIDKICLTAREKLVYNKSQLFFRDSRNVDFEIAKYKLDNNGANPIIWDVTDPLAPQKVKVSTNVSQTTFLIKNDGRLRDFVAFEPINLKHPIVDGPDLGRIDNQDLHGSETPDMVIVYHPDFLSQAEELAEFHEKCDGFNVQIVTQQQIFNEFSGGMPDVSAIRNYAKMLYDRNGRFKYLLLFGDGTFDNKNVLGEKGRYVLTYQSEESESQNNSFVCDDFFAILDDGECGLDGTMDIGVGRLPASTVEEAQDLVDKIKSYVLNPNYGSWRNYISFIADDEEDGSFVTDAERLCSIIEANSPECNVYKIYLDAYTQVSGSSGAMYPDVTSEIKKQLSSGTVIMEYIGHGNPSKIAHETIFKAQDATQLTNKNKLTFFITASCEVGRYDDPNQVSLGERLVKNPNGGAIASLTTTRVVYTSSNYELSKNVFQQKPGENVRLGDLVANAKNATGSVFERNKRSYVLLGDPALRLAHPCNNKVIVSRINGKSVENALSDTINAVDTVTLEGYLCDDSNNVLRKNGVLYSTVYDKANILSTNGNDESSPIISFVSYNSVLYQGKASITDGYFECTFIMPKDINFSYGLGRISLYAVVDSMDISGYSNSIVVGGVPDNVLISDFDGPQIELFMNDTNFVDGQIVGNSAMFIARLFDESGINTTGNGIGHDITIVLDGDTKNTLVLNNYYESYINQYQAGEVRFRLEDLAEGEHTLMFKAWDIYNNSADAEISFVVKNSNSAFVGNVYNYPNPASTDTYFVINHNQTESDLNVNIVIRDLAGRKIAAINARRGVGDTSPIHWTCQQNGKPLANGIYVYTAEISSSAGKSTKSGKMIISRQ